MPTAIVTGGAGLVGRHFAERLAQDGYAVTVVDNLSAGESPAWKRVYSKNNINFIQADIRHFIRLGGQPFDLVVHCAAVVGGRLKIDGDPIAVATDLAIDSDVFNWLVKMKPAPKRVVYFSSSAVYPTSLQTRAVHVALHESLVSFDTDRIGMPDQTYGFSKLAGELLALHAVRNYGIPMAVYRPFSGYGEDQDFSYPFPSILRRVGRGGNPVVIWGSGEQVRDFIHIDDVVECVLSTMDQLPPGEPLNIGTGKPTSFMALANMAYDCIRHDCYRTLSCDPSKPEGVFWRVADPYKMLQLFTPKVSLEEGIERVHAYQKKHGLLDSGLMSA